MVFWRHGSKFKTGLNGPLGQWPDETAGIHFLVLLFIWKQNCVSFMCGGHIKSHSMCSAHWMIAPCMSHNIRNSCMCIYFYKFIMTMCYITFGFNNSMSQHIESIFSNESSKLHVYVSVALNHRVTGSQITHIELSLMFGMFITLDRAPSHYPHDYFGNPGAVISTHCLDHI